MKTLKELRQEAVDLVSHDEIEAAIEDICFRNGSNDHIREYLEGVIAEMSE